MEERKKLTLLNLLKQQILECKKCDLWENGRCGIYFDPIFGIPKYLMIGEAPGKNEVSKKMPFVGQAGNLLWRTIKPMGFDRENFAIINTVQCRPVEVGPGGMRNGKPQIFQQQKCRPWIRKFVKILKPQAGILLGNYAVNAIAGIGGSITKVNGQIHDLQIDTEFEIPMVLSVHPSFCIYSPHKKYMLEDSFKVLKEHIKNV